VSAKVGVGIIGSGFIAEIHAESMARVPNARVVAAASPTAGRAAEFAGRHGIPHHYSDYREMLARDDIQVVSLALPNDLHVEATEAAAAAGKHVICEKPISRTLAEADRMIEACRAAGVQLFYAEELCFAPKYVRAKLLADDGALGDVFLVKQSEEHSGPHAPWFWDVRRSGGGVLMDMGCHGIAFARWVLNNQAITQVSATMGTFVHGDKTKGEDHSVCVLTFEGGAMAIIEDSWAKGGGMDDQAEIYGTLGHTRADLIRGNSLTTYSEAGYGYAVEKAGLTTGWTFTVFEELWNYGFPQEMQYFVDCVANDTPSAITGEDGRIALEAIYAAYHSAGTGQAVSLPFNPPNRDANPIDLWLSPAR
jgi:myo-inositol 2-dehydrogenase/D-chiro-inositol 1-dehydrogenase